MNAVPAFSPDEHEMHFGRQRELPASIDAEAALLGAIMMNPDVYHAVADRLEPAHFSEPLHRAIFEKLGDLIRLGKSPNPVTLKPHLPSEMVGELTMPQYLSRLVSASVGAANAVGYADAIRIAGLRRELIGLGRQMSDSAYAISDEWKLSEEASAIMDRAGEVIGDLAGREQTIGAGASYLTAFEAASKRDTIPGVAIGIPEIARVLSEPSFEAGNLYGLLSSSSEGKTSLTLQLMMDALKKGHPVLFLSYDQSPQQCVRQWIAQEYGIEQRRQREPYRLLGDKERTQCAEFALWIDKRPLEIIRCRREGVSELVRYADRFVKRRGNGLTPFIVTDHINKIKPRDPRLSPDRIASEVTVELKASADKLQAVHMILNQRNTTGTARDNPRPIARDLYGGEGARQDYDACLYLYRQEKYKNERIKTAASDADWKKINSVFGSDVEGIAEIGCIKARFSDPNITEIIRFDAKYTRYVSPKRQSHEEMLPL